MKKNKKLVATLTVILVILIGICIFLVTKDKTKDEDKINGETVVQQDDDTKKKDKEQKKDKGQKEDAENPEDAVSTLEEQIKSEDAYEIETEYCKLYYPAKWKENVETEIVESEGYAVKFYGVLEGKDKQPLFEVIFNSDADMMLGTIERDGESIYVGFNFKEPEMGDDWTAEETDTIYAMQEDVNYLIGMLQKEEGFKAE